MRTIFLSLVFFISLFAYIPSLGPLIKLNSQKNRSIQSFYAKSKIVLANDPSKEITEELWYSNKGILRSNLMHKDETLSVKITRPDKSEIYGREVKVTEDLTPSFLPGVFLFSSLEFLTKLVQDMGIPLKVNMLNPQGEFVNFGFGTLLQYASNLSDEKTPRIYFNSITKTLVGFRTSRNDRTLIFLATAMTAIEGKVIYPSTVEILNEEYKRIGTIQLITALANIPPPDQIGTPPGKQESNFWLHDWLR